MFKNTAIVFLFLVLSASFASASIVDANSRQGRVDIGLSTGILWSGYNIQYGINDTLSVGIDYGTADLTLGGGWIFTVLGEGNLTGDYYDLHLNYQILEADESQPVNASLLAGMASIQVKLDDKVQDSHSMIVGGICFSSRIIFDNLIGRLNLVVGPPLGAEIAWKITDNFELNAGVSAMGIFGAKISF